MYLDGARLGRSGSSTLRKALMALRSVVAAALGVLFGHRISIKTSVDTGRGRSVNRILSNWRACRVCQSLSVTAMFSRTTCKVPSVKI